MKNEKILQSSFINKENNNINKNALNQSNIDFTIHNVVSNSDINSSNPKCSENSNSKSNSNSSNNNKFQNLDCESSIVSERDVSLNSIELCLESSKGTKKSKAKGKDNEKNICLDKSHIRNIILLTVLLNVFAGVYIYVYSKKIQYKTLIILIYLSISIIEWIAIIFAIYYTTRR